MKPGAFDIRRGLAWLAVAAYVFFGGNAVAGIVTCFGLDGHVAIELTHANAADDAAKAVTALRIGGHGPCVDVSIESPVKATQEKPAPRSDQGMTPVALVASSPQSPKPALFHGIIWPAAPPARSALLHFSQTVRLLI
jgi:hypothetical protein